MPFVLFERTIIPERGPDVRECPICTPTTIACSHFDGMAVILGCRHYTSHTHPLRWPASHDDWIVVGPCPHRDISDCDICGLRNSRFPLSAPYSYHDTEAEARAEFSRRVALMLEAE